MSGIMLSAMRVSSATSPPPPPPPPPPSIDTGAFLSGPNTVSSASGSSSGTLGCSPSGGTPPYTYSWTKTGSSKISLSGTTTQSPTITWTGLNVGEYVTGFFNLTVHDSAGLTGFSAPSYDITRTS